MNVKPTEHQIRVLTALRAGGMLIMHTRGERGPYYTLNGRRLSMTVVKDLEAARWITREGSAGRIIASYQLTSAGGSVLAEWQATRSPLATEETEETEEKGD